MLLGFFEVVIFSKNRVSDDRFAKISRADAGVVGLRKMDSGQLRVSAGAR
jgi:hypothetical protein